MTLKRIRFMQEFLEFVGFGGRLHLEWISSAEAQKFVQVVGDFTEKIRVLGPNPLKCLERTAMVLGPKPLSTPAERRPQASSEPRKHPGPTTRGIIGRTS